ncbi:ferritin family protein [Myxococcota bacterium]|nr:ferritin family protein [Myxococcota bacterium]MBU1383212.1 ferritin family protein [Myxococcota bacterium]MBU1499164.1 ferritin family protein [Myxococcota bacterium]
MEDKTLSTILSGLQKAIQIERDGYYFYMMAAKSTSDPEGHRAFESLANEEKEHERILKLQFDSLKNTGNMDSSLTAAPSDNSIGSFFSEEFAKRASEAHYEMSALSIGVQLELQTIEHYRKLSEASEDPVVKVFFGNMVEWEKSHYEYLNGELEVLKNIYWSDSGFSPY